jgi:hypothetical protein
MSRLERGGEMGDLDIAEHLMAVRLHARRDPVGYQRECTERRARVLAHLEAELAEGRTLPPHADKLLAMYRRRTAPQ